MYVGAYRRFLKDPWGAWLVENNIVNNFISVRTLCIFFWQFYSSPKHKYLYVCRCLQTFFKGSLGAWLVENNIVNNFISVWTLCIFFSKFYFSPKHTYLYVCRCLQTFFKVPTDVFLKDPWGRGLFKIIL